MDRFASLIRSLANEDDGASLAEYLVLLGILVLVTAGGILALAAALSDGFQSWATWIGIAGGPPD